VRVAADQLVHQVTGDIVDVPGPAVRKLLGEPGVQDHLEQHIAQLLAQRRIILRLDRVVCLVCLLQQEPGQALVGLRALPRIAAGRRQPVHHGHRVQQPRARRIPRPVQQLHFRQARLAGQPQTQLPGQLRIALRPGEPHRVTPRQQVVHRPVGHCHDNARRAQGPALRALRGREHGGTPDQVPRLRGEQPGRQPG
jgi:hypothetical protein